MEQGLKPELVAEAVSLLQELIAIPSVSRQEDKTADRIFSFLAQKNLSVSRTGNNVWVKNQYFQAARPTILLNSHHDTVAPNAGYTRNPCEATLEGDKLYGLGSNDAGGPLVALLATFLHYQVIPDLPFNLIFAATAEEEISGNGGVSSIIAALGDIHLAIVGEPTKMELAVAERGLLVIDCVAKGKAGHAARNEGLNAIYEAMKDIEWFHHFHFPQSSPWLGDVSMNVTVIAAGHSHNQVPAACNFVVDIRLNEHYTHQQVLEIIRKHISCEVKERSTRIKPSFINFEHPFVQAAKALDIKLYGSPTTSDMALMPWTAVKLGPGDSARSHTADEFILISEIKQGIETYIHLLHRYSLHLISTQQKPTL